MTWLAQLRHLLIKDLTEHRWTVLLYVAAVLVATGHTLGWQPFASSTLGMTMVFIGLIGAVLAASIVQGDSPTRSDAFWASHPIDASAVLAAKLCLGAAVLALPLLAQMIALHGYDVTWSDAFMKSIHDSRMYALIVLGALVVAALTRDLKSFVLTVIAIPVALLICVAILSLRHSSWGIAVTATEAAVATLLCAFVELVLLAWLYHTRDSRWLTRVAGFALVGLSFVGLTMSSPSTQPNPIREAKGIPHVPLHVAWATRRDWITRSPLAMTLTIGAPPEGLRYALERTSATVRMRDGSTADLWVSWNEFDFSQNSAVTPPAIPGIRWLNLTPEDSADTGAERVMNLDPTPTDAQRLQLQAGVESVVLKGYIAVTRLSAGDTLPLARGALVVHGGRRTQVEKWRRGPDGALLEVRMRRALGPSIFSGADFAAPEDLVLVNRARGEGVVLLRLGNNFTGDGMVIPGSTMTSQLVQYSFRYVANGRPAIDDAWLRDAKLQVVDAEPLGSYPVTLPPLTVPAPTQPGEEKTPGGR
ncbi:MAG: hypothetical protein ACJ79K_18385 [Gemmatimonadaceae bacterium]